MTQLNPYLLSAQLPFQDNGFGELISIDYENGDDSFASFWLSDPYQWEWKSNGY